MLGDQISKGGFVLLDCRHGCSLIRLHHGGITDDVGEEDSGKAMGGHNGKISNLIRFFNGHRKRIPLGTGSFIPSVSAGFENPDCQTLSQNIHSYQDETNQGEAPH